MRLTATRVCVGALVTATLAGCSSPPSHRASVASSFGQQLSTNRSASKGPTTMPSPTAATTAVEPAPPSGGSGASPTPCPVASPQLFVEGKHAAVNGGQVTFSYLDATRICSGDENSRYLTTGKSLTTKPVSPSAVILLLPPGGGADELQVPTPALPAAMAAGQVGPPYYTITVDGSGTITRIEQAYLP